MASSHGDIIVLNCSPVFNRLIEGTTPMVSYEVKRNAYDKPYYLADGIYPNWITLVKTICNPQTEKEKRFANMQEVYEDARGCEKRCGAGIWCAPNSVSYCLSPSANLVSRPCITWWTVVWGTTWLWPQWTWMGLSGWVSWAKPRGRTWEELQQYFQTTFTQIWLTNIEHWLAMKRWWVVNLISFYLLIMNYTLSIFMHDNAFRL
jgi:hypothetical protein